MAIEKEKAYKVDCPKVLTTNQSNTDQFNFLEVIRCFAKADIAQDIIFDHLN